MKAIKNLEDRNADTENAEYLSHIMKYYLAVKLIRNRVNHASEKEISPDEQNAIETMKKDYAIDINMEFDNIKQILYDGITGSILPRNT